MPFVRIWVHLIWTTKNREALIGPDLREKLLEHIQKNAEDKNITLETVNMFMNHAHALILMKSDQSIAKVAQLMKGESSHWVNENEIVPFKFEWQDECIAASVSESVLETVRRYIQNQDQHHKKDRLDQHYEEFLKTYGFQVTS